MTVLKSNLVASVFKRLAAVKDCGELAPSGIFPNDPSCDICQLRDRNAGDICGTICTRSSSADSLALSFEGSTRNAKSHQRCYGNRTQKGIKWSHNFAFLHHPFASLKREARAKFPLRYAKGSTESRQQVLRDAGVTHHLLTKVYIFPTRSYACYHDNEEEEEQ